MRNPRLLSRCGHDAAESFKAHAFDYTAAAFLALTAARPSQGAVNSERRVIPLSTIDRALGHHRFGPTNDPGLRSCLDE
jgi:hypothetical protein